MTLEVYTENRYAMVIFCEKSYDFEEKTFLTTRRYPMEKYIYNYMELQI